MGFFNPEINKCVRSYKEVKDLHAQNDISNAFGNWCKKRNADNLHNSFIWNPKKS